MKSSDPSILQGKTIDQILDATWQYMIPFTMVDGNGLTKEKVVKAVCRHYWMREIGMETVGLWRYAIGTRLQEVMPKYAEMALAQAEMGSIWETTNRSKTHEGSDRRTGSQNETGNDTRTINTTGKDDTTEGKTGSATTDFTHDDNGNVTTITKDRFDKTLTEDGSRDTTTEGSEKIGGEWHQSNTDSHHTDNTASGDSKDKYSDTPQNGLSAVDEGNYLTNYRNIESGSTNAENGNGKSESQHTSLDTNDSNGTQKEVYEYYHNHDQSGERDQVATDVRKTIDKTEVATKDDQTIAFTTKRDVMDDLDHSKNMSSQESGSNEYTEKWTGFDGNKAELMSQFNDLYVNIYQMIIGEVSGFFMTILG